MHDNVFHFHQATSARSLSQDIRNSRSVVLAIALIYMHASPTPRNAICLYIYVCIYIQTSTLRAPWRALGHFNNFTIISLALLSHMSRHER